MNARTEQLLYLLLWGADQLMRPTFRNLNDSFESWAYRNGFHRQLGKLEARGLLEHKAGGAAEAIYRLSESGRLLALGGRDPVARWKRGWDGQWRLIMFDLPETRASARVKLRRYLRECDFGFLQNSVWISPDPIGEVLRHLSAQAKDVESLVTLEARPGAGETDAEIVAGAWDFAAINRRYERCLQVLGQLPQGSAGAAALAKWAKLERLGWLEAVSGDPLLPEPLLPEGYLGRKAWAERSRALSAAARLAARKTRPGDDR